MSWQSDIKQALERCEVPLTLHEEALYSFRKAKKTNAKTMVYNVLAPFVTPFLLWNLPWENEELDKWNHIYGNEAMKGTGLNGDKRAWLPPLKHGYDDLVISECPIGSQPVGVPLPAPVTDVYPKFVEDHRVADETTLRVYGRLEPQPASDLVYYGWGWAKKLYKAFGGKIHPRDNFCRYLFIGLRNRASMYAYTNGVPAEKGITEYGNPSNSERNPGEGFYRMGNQWQYRSHKKKFSFLGYDWFRRHNVGYKIDNVFLHQAERAMVVFTTRSYKGHIES